MIRAAPLWDGNAVSGLGILLHPGVGYVKSEVHTVVQNTYYFDVPHVGHSIKQQVAPAPSMPSDMEGKKAPSDVFAFSGSWYIRPDAKLANGLHEGCPIACGLPGAESFGCPLQNAQEVSFRERAEANAPTLRRHGSIWPP